MNPRMRLNALMMTVAVSTTFYLPGETMTAPAAEMEESLRVALTEIAVRPLLRGPRVPSTPELVAAYLTSNAVPVSLAVRVAKEMAEEACAQVEEADRLHELRSMERRKVRRLLEYLGKANDWSVLPFLEEKVWSSSPWVRGDAVPAYASLAGYDSGPFLMELMAKAPDRAVDRSDAYEQLRKMVKSGKMPDSASQVEAFYGCLLALAEQENSMTAARELDALLCAGVEGYDKSVQRQRLCRRFVDYSKSESVRKDFRKRLAEVEILPEDRRVDLRQRFPLKGVDAEKEP